MTLRSARLFAGTATLWSLAACVSPLVPPSGPPLATESAIPAIADTELARAARSSEAATRERAVIVLGDLPRPDAGSVDAVVAALDDPVAAVRLHAVAALRRMGPVVTVPLLSRLSDEERSVHVDTVESGCGGRQEFVPRRGDLAAAALAIAGDVDADAFWAQFRRATGPVKRRLTVVANTRGVVPSPAVLATLTSFDADDLELLLMAATSGGPETATALAAVLSDVRARATSSTARALDRALMRTLAGMPRGPGELLRQLVAQDPWPENVVAALLGTAPLLSTVTTEPARERLEMVAPAFRAAVAAERQEALDALADSLQSWVARSQDAGRSGSALSAAAGEPAVLTFIRRASPATADGQRTLLIALAPFAAQPFARADLLAQVKRYVVARDPEVRAAARALLARLARASNDPHDHDLAWRIFLDALAAAPPIGEAGEPRVDINLPPPSPAAERATAAALVDAVMARRLDAKDLQRWAGRTVADRFAEAIRDATRAAAARNAGPPIAVARLLDTVGAEPGVRIKVLRDVVKADGALADTLWALDELTEHAAEVPGVIRDLVGMLRVARDETTAQAIARQIMTVSRDGAAVWTVAADPSAPEPNRRAAWTVASRQARFERSAWIERGIALVSSRQDGSVRIGLDVLKTFAPPAAGESTWSQSSGEASWPVTASEWPSANRDLSARLGAVLAPILRASDERVATAAGLVWRAYGLAPETALRSLREAGHPPVTFPPTAAAELDRLRSLAPGSAAWTAAVTAALHSPDRRMFCGTVELLPAFGPHAAIPVAELVVGLETSRARQAVWQQFGRGVTGVCRRGETLGVTIRRVVGSAPPGTGPVALVLALARIAGEPDEPAGAPLTEGDDRLLRPLAIEHETFRLEHSRPDTEPVGADTIGDILRSAVVPPLLRELERGGRPGRFWSLVALAGFGAHPPGDRSQTVQAPLGVTDRASLTWQDATALDRLLAALAARWADLTPAERSRLLPLFGWAAPTDGMLARVLAVSLSSASAGERRRAISLAAGLRLTPPELAGAAELHAWYDALRARLSSRLGMVFDKLYPLRSVCASAASVSRPSLPLFPWPPPAGYRTAEPMSLSLFGGAGTTAGLFFDRLRAAFAQVSPDYEIGLFGGPPDGFAVVARLERIHADGVPYPGRVRWTSEGQPKVALSELLGDLFLERPGYFRVIAFVVTSQSTFSPSPRDPLPPVTAGAQLMPDQLAGRPLAGLYVFALVYAFERPAGGVLRAWIDGSPSARRHLEVSGLWSRLAPKP